ncbi:MAG: hypothetical protein IJ774_03595, partial [Selenomonadaceae bacterium]|nr:hypothetical protein [Selenomonadaceae bacterium]
MAVENNWDNDVTIMGTDEGDELNNWNGSNVEIYAAAGNDSVMNWGSFNVIINAGADNDSVMNWQGTYLIVDAGNGSDTVRNSGTNVTISGGEGDDSINNDKLYTIIDEENVTLCPDYTSIDAGDGNDNISNEGNNVTISAGNGNDTISNNGGSNVMLNGGAGNDKIDNSGSDVSINGGDGNDFIVNHGASNVMLNGGDGNDTLTGNSAVDVFAYAGGNDVITNYSGEDIVYISTGGINSYSFNGADLIFNVNGGSLTLKSMKNHAITVQDAFGNVSLQIYGTGYSGADVMRTFVQSMANSSLDTDQKIDEAIKACSHFNSLQEVKNQIITDLQIAGDGETFLRDYCGIFLDNADTGAVTGWDAGGLTVKTTDDLLPTSYSDAYPPSTSFTKRGLTLIVPERSTLSENEQLIVQSLYTEDVENSLKLIEETYGFTFSDKPLSIPLYFVYESDKAPAWAGVGGLTINTAHDYSGNYIIPHELTHVAQQHFGFFNYMTDFMIEGMADITANGDVRPVLELANDSSKLAKCLNGNNTGGDAYVSGVIFWRYLMRQAADTSSTDNPPADNPSIDNPPADNPSIDNNQFVYTGGDKTISNYAGQPITLGAYTGATFDDSGNFFVGSPTGTLVITNA